MNLAHRCGKPNREGKPCETILRGGTCPSHRRGAKDFLLKRNRKAFANRVANNPEAWSEHQKRAGMKNWHNATNLARLRRIRFPSEPERWIRDFLGKHLPLDVYVDREHEINGDPRAIDFAFVPERIAIEVNSHATTPNKKAWLEAQGWIVYVVSANNNRANEERKLLEFLRAHNLI